jgi:hypothetical protein
VHEPSPGLIGARIIEIVENGDEDLQHVRALQHVEQELLVVLAELPEEDQQLLMEVDLPHIKVNVALRDF